MDTGVSHLAPAELCAPHGQRVPSLASLSHLTASFPPQGLCTGCPCPPHPPPPKDLANFFLSCGSKLQRFLLQGIFADHRPGGHPVTLSARPPVSFGALIQPQLRPSTIRQGPHLLSHACPWCRQDTWLTLSREWRHRGLRYKRGRAVGTGNPLIPSQCLRDVPNSDGGDTLQTPCFHRTETVRQYEAGHGGLAGD